MAKLPERVLAETRQGKEENETVRRFGIDPAAWDGLMDTLYSRLHLHEWPPAEGEAPEDGWQLKVSLRGGRVFTWAGGDGFPPYGAELKALFAPYLPDSGS